MPELPESSAELREALPELQEDWRGCPLAFASPTASLDNPAMASVLHREAEADRILADYGPNAFGNIMAMLERQFGVLHNRAQVLLTLCGIIISTTGFSGRNIAGTGLWAQWLIVGGVAGVLIAAGLVCFGVLHLRWLSMQPGDDVRAWLITSLRYRDLKTSCYWTGLLVMLVALAAYVGAVVIMLLNPDSAPNYAPR